MIHQGNLWEGIVLKRRFVSAANDAILHSYGYFHMIAQKAFDR